MLYCISMPHSLPQSRRTTHHDLSNQPTCSLTSCKSPRNILYVGGYLRLPRTEFEISFFRSWANLIHQWHSLAGYATHYLITNAALSLVTLLTIYLNNRMFMSRNYRLIVAPRKFDVLKSSIFARDASFKNIKFPWGNYQPIVPRHKHSIVFIVHH